MVNGSYILYIYSNDKKSFSSFSTPVSPAQETGEKSSCRNFPKFNKKAKILISEMENNGKWKKYTSSISKSDDCFFKKYITSSTSVSFSPSGKHQRYKIK